MLHAPPMVPQRRQATPSYTQNGFTDKTSSIAVHYSFLWGEKQTKVPTAPDTKYESFSVFTFFTRAETINTLTVHMQLPYC